MKIEYIDYNNCWNGTYPENPLTSYDDYENQVLVFLVRGVDPYSSRKENSYDLSRLFGYNTCEEKKIIIHMDKYMDKYMDK